LPDALVTPAVALSPAFSNDHTIYAGTNGGVLRSEDGGRSWVLGNMPKPPPVITVLLPSPNFEQDGIIFAGSMEDGVLRSPDRGTQWHRWNFGLVDLHILTLAISPNFAKDQTLWVGTDTGIFRSINGGRSWRPLNFPSDWAPVLSLAVSPAYPDDETLFAGTEMHGLYLSRDDGKSWQRVSAEMFPETVNTVLVSADFDGALYLAVATDSALSVSYDAGNTWHNLELPLPEDEGISTVAAPLGIRPGAPLLVGITDGRILQCSVASHD
ncbi:MAG: WD40/YVTN/BNR-like repeat-containing protein, partial [Anaerolineae bacterium]